MCIPLRALGTGILWCRLEVASFRVGVLSQFVGERYELLVRVDLKLFG
jgi:hypothetical protein